MASKHQIEIAHHRKVRQRTEKEKVKAQPAQILKEGKQETLKGILKILCSLSDAGHRNSQEFQMLWNKFNSRCDSKIPEEERLEAIDFLKPKEKRYAVGSLTQSVRSKLHSYC